MERALRGELGDVLVSRRGVDDRKGMEVGLHHRIVSHLASGGMGQVYLAERIETGAYAAAKFSLTENEVPRELLDHEAAVLERFQHPNIVRFYEIGTTFDGQDYLLLEYVPGIDLASWLTLSPSRMSRATLLSVLCQLGSAIDYVHARGIVHSDIKPANVMFDQQVSGSVRLVDFGLAFDGRDACARRGSAGTPGYMAPEQLRAEPCGPAIDRFAFASLAFELLTGFALQPWATLSRVRAHAKLRGDALDHRSLVGPELEHVFEHALHDRAEQRFASCSSFVSALRSALEAEQARSDAHAMLSEPAARMETWPTIAVSARTRSLADAMFA